MTGDTRVTEFTGVDGDGKIIIDSYSGESAHPRFKEVWREYCEGKSAISHVHATLLASGLSWGLFGPDDIDLDAPFIWRSLTREESRESVAAYDEAGEV